MPDETLDTAEYAVVELGRVVALIASWAERDRKALLREDGELILAEARLYAVLQNLGLTLARAA